MAFDYQRHRDDIAAKVKAEHDLVKRAKEGIEPMMRKAGLEARIVVYPREDLVTEKTPAPDSERVSMMFFKSAFEYYIAGRFAVCAALGPVSGNLFHHAIEMCLKGALAAKGATLADLKKVYHHSLPRLWGEFKVRHQGPSLDEFDEVISRLHDFEDLRYPDSVLSEGMMLRIDLGKRTTTTTPALDVSRPEPVYELYLGDVDELMGQVLDVANQNPKFYTVGFQGPAREFLVKHNSVTKLTAEG